MSDEILRLEAEAYAFEKDGKFGKAKELYWQVIKKGFEGSFPYERLRTIYVKEKKWEEAIDVCTKYVELHTGYGGYQQKSKRMQHLITKYKAKLGKVEIPTAKNVLKNCVSTASRFVKTRRKMLIPEYTENIVFPLWARREINLKTIPVPEFHQHYSNELFMDKKQKRFYNTWKHNWIHGIPIDVKGNISYLFTYSYDLIRSVKNQPRETILQLRLLQKAYKSEPYFVQYLSRWIFDVYLLQSDYLKAIAYIESRSGSEKINYIDNVILSLKYKLGLPLRGIDLVSMYRVTPRKLVLDNLGYVVEWLDGLIEEFEEENDVDLLSLITEKFAFKENSYTWLFSGAPFHEKIKLNSYNYLELGEFKIVLNEWFKDAENQLRKEKGLPKIGEGWISETLLYNIVSKIFSEMGYDVLHHSYPAFLDRQELDIHVPQLKLGIEYMGAQHYAPIDFFGGRDGFEKTKARDEKKRRVCKKFGVEVIDFRYDEPIEEKYVRSKLKKFISIASDNRTGL